MRDSSIIGKDGGAAATRGPFGTYTKHGAMEIVLPWEVLSQNMPLFTGFFPTASGKKGGGKKGLKQVVFIYNTYIYTFFPYFHVPPFSYFFSPFLTLFPPPPAGKKERRKEGPKRTRGSGGCIFSPTLYPIFLIEKLDFVRFGPFTFLAFC